VTPELQRQIRVSTFEVVMKKPADGSVSYEKPLPLELLPFIERTDPYQSIGTAFAIGANSFVTAAHVLAAAAGSQYGAPALRAADGTVHPITNIEKFSAFEDFVVFSLADDLKSAPLPVSRSPHVDDRVAAVGNALGEGIVIRDGLFTSETPEEQDGRWKWIRFSAAASPGNSGGPLLDAEGNVIGVVIAKSPNENLNYALPIGIVLDAPQARARFDERILTKLAYAQGSKTYVLKDEFALPLTWARFVTAYQSLLERHSDKAREAFLSAYATSLFPHGTGTEAILYGPDSAGRGPAVVTQQSDGNWAILEPDFQFTDLPGDGKVGVTFAAGALLLTLHRGNEADDDAFYSDSKSFMDIALRALNLRRPVGTDQVKVVSLGPATTDATTTDTYGRKWQVRVWPVPFRDMYLVALLLPTPDGYAGLIQYAPSIRLREAKLESALLANQVTVTYEGTINQWRAFLARQALLPDALKAVKLESGSTLELHTRRFETSVPASLLTTDAHSELVLDMNYTLDGAQVVWDIGGACWYRDAQEKAFVGLWRKPRPPPTAKLDMRRRFDDMEARRSPYDGSPVRATSDALEIWMSIQAPGTKGGMASSDVVYALNMRLDGHPSAEELAARQAAALESTRILEHGVGQDVAASSGTTLSGEMAANLKAFRDGAKQCDAAGRDIRGRLCSEDLEKYVTPLYQDAYRIPIGTAGAEDVGNMLTERAKAVSDYWTIAPTVVHNRDLWQPFLSHNHLSGSTPHGSTVLTAESNLNALFSKGGAPNADWTWSSRALAKAYVEERNQMARKMASDRSIVVAYRPRRSNCPAPATKTSGTEKPRPGPSSRPLSEFYPTSLRRSAVEGLVVISVKVNSSGCATAAGILGSSGSDEMDEAALEWVETATFLPAEKDGIAVDASESVAIAFKLDE
jgi:TonB family protein